MEDIKHAARERAKSLGLSRTALYRRMEKHDLLKPEAGAIGSRHER